MRDEGRLYAQQRKNGNAGRSGQGKPVTISATRDTVSLTVRRFDAFSGEKMDDAVIELKVSALVHERNRLEEELAGDEKVIAIKREQLEGMNALIVEHALMTASVLGVAKIDGT